MPAWLRLCTWNGEKSFSINSVANKPIGENKNQYKKGWHKGIGTHDSGCDEMFVAVFAQSKRVFVSKTMVDDDNELLKHKYK